MESQKIVEVLDKNSFSLTDLKTTVYSTLSSLSTRREPLTIENVKCTFSYKKPQYVQINNPDDYVYFIMELGEVGG